MQSVNRYILYLVVALFLVGGGLVWASAEDDYQAAKVRLTAFKNNTSHHKYRDKWLSLIDAFEQVRGKYPKHPRACDALYNIATLYQDMAEVSYLSADRRKAAESFEKLASDCPGTSLADDGLYHAATLYVRLQDPVRARFVLKSLLDRFPKGDMAPKAKTLLAELGGSPSAPSPSPQPQAQTQQPPPRQDAAKPVVDSAQTQSAGDDSQQIEPRGGQLITPESGPILLQNATWESSGHFTRLKLVFSRMAAMTSGEVPAGGGLPRRLYFDFVNTQIADSVTVSSFEVNDSRVRRIRLGQFGPTVVRVVFELTPEAGSFGLSNELRPPTTVIDIKNAMAQPAPVVQKPAPSQAGKPVPPPQDPKPQPGGSPIKVVVIDPGHGGDDTGAIGPKGTLEKQIVLQIALRVKRLLEKHGIKVILTRQGDKGMELFDRTKIANEAHADLFISIHCNANQRSKFRGVEVFYLNNSSDDYSRRLATRENTVKGEPVSDLDFILTDLSMHVNVDDSILLANMVQKSLVKRLKKTYKDTVDRGVRRALFHVLLYARMPAVLVETSFISNPTEEKRLKDGTYQEQLAQGIVDGVLRYAAKKKQGAN